jgi:hypothetical protein
MEHGMSLWSPVMFWGEFDMLDCRLEAMAGHDVRTVLVEAPWTHRGTHKPLLFIPECRRYPDVLHVVDDRVPDAEPWVLEHHQRNAAWKVIDAEAADDDVVLICDVDEIPSPDLLACAAQYGTHGPPWPVKVPMRLFLFAVDWEVMVPQPAPCVLAPVRYLRDQAACGRFLAEVRDSRDLYPQLGGDGQTWGWHFSWVGGPERQRVKLETGTCHTEILATPEADLIRSGARWRSAEDGGGLPVVPVDVDETWPPPVYERRCPENWFRPRDEEVAG